MPYDPVFRFQIDENGHGRFLVVGPHLSLGEMRVFVFPHLFSAPDDGNSDLAAVEGVAVGYQLEHLYSYGVLVFFLHAHQVVGDQGRAVGNGEPGHFPVGVRHQASVPVGYVQRLFHRLPDQVELGKPADEIDRVDGMPLGFDFLHEPSQDFRNAFLDLPKSRLDVVEGKGQSARPENGGSAQIGILDGVDDNLGNLGVVVGLEVLQILVDFVEFGAVFVGRHAFFLQAFRNQPPVEPHARLSKIEPAVAVVV